MQFPRNNRRTGTDDGLSRVRRLDARDDRGARWRPRVLGGLQTLPEAVLGSGTTCFPPLWFALPKSNHGSRLQDPLATPTGSTAINHWRGRVVRRDVRRSQKTSPVDVLATVTVVVVHEQHPPLPPPPVPSKLSRRSQTGMGNYRWTRASGNGSAQRGAGSRR